MLKTTLVPYPEVSKALDSTSHVIIYVRDYRGEPYGTVIAMEKDQNIRYGWSLLGNNDSQKGMSFSKKLGKQYAYTRLLECPTKEDAIKIMEPMQDHNNYDAPSHLIQTMSRAGMKLKLLLANQKVKQLQRQLTAVNIQQPFA